MKVEYINHMGDDLQIVNAAKVSFGKRSEWHYSGVDTNGPPEKRLHAKDRSLIQFLARGCTSGDWDNLVYEVYETGWEDGKKGFHDYNSSTEIEDLLNHIRKMPSHWSPFAHTAITLHLKMPIFVARQIMKHTTGLEYNEVSRRYVDSEPEIFFPKEFRVVAADVKQGSGGTHPKNDKWQARVREYSDLATHLYEDMLEDGVAPEQARMYLPHSMYTEVIATGNLYAWANLYIQRTDSHAQKETQDLAKQIGEITQTLYPVSWEALCS
tara:strand:- start:7662 stop:8465 length:804 start_codon:yes stop_codon:yes gene_type:complete